MERPSLATWISPAASPPGTEAPETAEAEMTHRGYEFCLTGGNTQREYFCRKMSSQESCFQKFNLGHAR